MLLAMPMVAALLPVACRTHRPIRADLPACWKRRWRLRPRRERRLRSARLRLIRERSVWRTVRTLESPRRLALQQHPLQRGCFAVRWSPIQVLLPVSALILRLRRLCWPWVRTGFRQPGLRVRRPGRPWKARPVSRRWWWSLCPRLLPGLRRSRWIRSLWRLNQNAPAQSLQRTTWTVRPVPCHGPTPSRPTRLRWRRPALR